MNAAETIQAAINKLEILKADVTPGPWESGLVGVWGSSGYVAEDIDMTFADRDLIVALHRTINAQLAILRVARVERPANQKLGLDLARAILGES